MKNEKWKMKAKKQKKKKGMKEWRNEGMKEWRNEGMKVGKKKLSKKISRKKGGKYKDNIFLKHIHKEKSWVYMKSIRRNL